MKDDRTDNWHGQRDFRDPNLWRFPRTSREAGFGDYKPMHNQHKFTKCEVCIVISLIAIVIGVLSWLN